METFPFPDRILEGSGGSLAFDTTTVPGNSTILTRDETGPDGLYRAQLSIILHGASELATWRAFVKAIRGGFDYWRFKEPLDTGLYQSVNEALGTADGANKDFALDYKHVDASTLVVKENGTPISAGLYSLVGNDSAPIVRYSSAPTAGKVITATYDFYMPVRFMGTVPLPEWLSGVDRVYVRNMAIEEIYGGARLVVPNT